MEAKGAMERVGWGKEVTVRVAKGAEVEGASSAALLAASVVATVRPHRCSLEWMPNQH